MNEEFYVFTNQVWKNKYSHERIIVKSYIVDGLWDFEDLFNSKIIGQIHQNELETNWKFVEKLEKQIFDY